LPVDTLLLNCKIYQDGEIFEAGIAIEDEKIVKIGKQPNLPEASEKIDLKGYLALPGLIDAHVHLRDQELAYKETFYTGTAAAAAGGITTVLDMPNNKPTTMTAQTLQERMHIAEPQILTNVGFYSAFPEEKAWAPQIIDAGAVAFKIFLVKQIGGLNIDDDQEIIEVLSLAEKLRIPVAFHAEDKKEIEEKRQKLMLEGKNDISAFLEAHSAEAEVKSVKRTISLAKSSGAQVHVCHVSCSESLKLISEAKKRGIKISCEVTPHHLLLSSDNFLEEGSLMLTDPPVRSKEEQQFLWRGINEGIIDIVASDHAPHMLEEKFSDEIWKVSPGVPGVETILPLMLTQVNKGLISIDDLVRLMAENPARIFGLKGKGALKNGFSADITIIDLNREGIIDSSKFYSKAKYSPFDGWVVKGLPVKTFVNGVLVMDEGEIVAKPGVGKVIRRKI